MSQRHSRRAFLSAAVKIEEAAATRSDTLTVEMREAGGFVGRFSV
jgi:hypothetical protein